MGEVQQRLVEKLNAALSPTHLVVTDESHHHAGHASAPEGGQSHFHVEISSPAFDGLTRVAQQRLINQALAEELAGPVHALRVSVV